jgi:hypothetical protein
MTAPPPNTRALASAPTWLRVLDAIGFAAIATIIPGTFLAPFVLAEWLTLPALTSLLVQVFGLLGLISVVHWELLRQREASTDASAPKQSERPWVRRAIRSSGIACLGGALSSAIAQLWAEDLSLSLIAVATYLASVALQWVDLTRRYSRA